MRSQQNVRDQMSFRFVMLTKLCSRAGRIEVTESDGLHPVSAIVAFQYERPEQGDSLSHIVFEVESRILHGLADVGERRKVNAAFDAVFLHDRTYQRAISDIAPVEQNIRGYGRSVPAREIVENDNRFAAAPEQLHRCAADVTCAACD